MAGELDPLARAQVDVVYRAESRRVFATLLRLLGDFELAEEALHEAFAVALEQWPLHGTPRNPRAWLISTGRFRGIDAIRRRRRIDWVARELQYTAATPEYPEPPPELDELIDDPLRLLFACCSPDLAADAQVALTLREVCGLTTEDIARAFLTRAPTVAQRIVRAKQRFREAHIPFELPSSDELPARRAMVMRVIYLVFNEGYAASSGPEHTRHDLCCEAIRLARLLGELLPHPETDGLLALLLLQHARCQARTSTSGDLIRFSDQDRSLWDQQLIAEGTAHLERALKDGACGTYTIQAAIAAVYAESSDNASVDWAQIVGLHELLERTDASPVTRLAKAIAVAGRDGPSAALPMVDELLHCRELLDYLPAHAARGEFCLRLGQVEEALKSFRRALNLAHQEPEQRFLGRRILEIEQRSVAEGR